MTSPFEETDFIDRDVHAGRPTRASPASSPLSTARPPSREELEAKATETQNRIAELKRAQEELERERTALEEARRRRAEFEAGRSETTTQLTRGIGLLEKAEFDARRDAEQMAKTLTGFREALTKVQAINEQAWTTETWNTELTRALTSIENARMEWNGARLKWPILDGAIAADRQTAASTSADNPLSSSIERRFGELCRLGFALTWPLALVALAGFIALCALLLRR